MKKKLLAAALAACLALSTLAACGGSDATSNTGSTGGNDAVTSGTEGGAEDVAEDVVEAPPLSEETEELKMIMLSVIGSVEEEDLVEEKINEIIEPQIHATVSIEWIDLGEYFNTIIARLASGEEIDVLPTFGTFLPALTGQEALMDITEYVSYYGQDIVASVGADYMKAGQINGAQYSIPIIAAYAQENALIYRTDIVEELGIDLSGVKSMEDLTAIFAEIHEKKPEITLICANSDNDPMLREFDWDGLGDEYGVIMNPTTSTEVVDLFETEEYKAYCELMHEWYQAGYIMTDAATTSDNLTTIFETGQYFGTIAKNYPGNIESKFSTSAYPFAAISISDPISTTNLVTNNVLAVPASSTHPEKSVAFMNILYSNADVQNLIMYGIEGQHYRLVDGRADYLEGEFIMSAKYVNKYMVGDYTLGYEAVTDPVGIHETIKEYNANSAASTALGFSYDSTDVANELTAIATVCAKYRRGLEAGSLDPETELPKFIEELKAAGIDTVVAAKQEQLDAWLAQQ